MELWHKELTHKIIGAAIEVHRELGSGFVEAVYQRALARELSFRGIPFREQAHLQVMYKNNVVGEYRADFVVNDCVLLEVKALPLVLPPHEAQLLHYLAATGIKVGLLINFGANVVQVKRLVR